MHLDSSQAKPECNNGIHVGTAVRGPNGVVLVTSSRNFALVSAEHDLRNWQERRVVISGVYREPETIEVKSIDEMMTECEILDCARFLVSKHGPHADEHVRNRLEAAIRGGSPQQIAVWRAIFRHFPSSPSAAMAPSAFLSTFPKPRKER